MFELLLALMTQCDPEAAHQVTYSIEIQDSELESERWEFIRAVVETLGDDRGWTRAGISFCPAKSDPDVIIILEMSTVR